jgi:hypothetical protein
MTSALSSLQKSNGKTDSPVANAATKIIAPARHLIPGGAQGARLKNRQHPAPFFTTANFLSVKLFI